MIIICVWQEMSKIIILASEKIMPYNFCKTASKPVSVVSWGDIGFIKVGSIIATFGKV